MRYLRLIMLPTCFLASPISAQDNLKATTPSISITASTSEEVVPDSATIQLGIVTERPTATEATAENARASAAVIDEIKAQGIAARDVKTISVTVGPIFDEERDANGRALKRTQKGFRARNELEVRTASVQNVGTLVKRLIDKGVNSFRGVTFSLSDAEQHLDVLRASAIKDALRRARIYTEAIGLKLGKVLEIDPKIEHGGGNEASLPGRPRQPAGTYETGYAVPIEAGVQKLSVTVSVLWELAQ
jgi:uncharacterized protein YggE